MGYRLPFLVFSLGFLLLLAACGPVGSLPKSLTAEAPSNDPVRTINVGPLPTVQKKKNVPMTPQEILFPTSEAQKNRVNEHDRERYLNDYQTRVDEYHRDLERRNGTTMPDVTIGTLNRDAPQVETIKPEDRRRNDLPRTRKGE